MPDKSKMSVAEILAAARKADGAQTTDSAAPTDPTPAPASEPPAAEATTSEPAASAATDQTAADQPEAAATSPAPKIPAKGPGRPSVAEMLAMARGEKKAPAATPAPAAASAAPAAKPAAAKPAAKGAPSKAAPAKTGPVDTQSILAAARAAKGQKPGPITKAEALAKGQTIAPKARPAKEKEQVFVPPMPVKPDYAKPAVQRTKEETRERRAFLFGLSALAVGFVALAGTSFLWVMGAVRFMFPNILREPPSQFKVGFPDQFPPEQVQEKFKAQFGIWVVNTAYNGEQQIFALKTVCTHLGCTPNWLEAEQKFKCPCHGSGFYKDGINFEGPAPRPLERYAISLADDGQIQVDKSRIFQEEMGQWNDPASYIPA